MSSFNSFSLLSQTLRWGNELVAGIPLVFAGVGEERERTFDRRRARRKEYGTIIAINGALRMDQISGLVQTDDCKN